MTKYQNIALLVSIGMHVIFLTGVPSFFPSPVKNQSSQEKMIEIFPQKIQAPKPQQEFEEFTPPPPYIEDFLEKFMLDTHDKVSLHKSDFVEERVKEITLEQIPHTDTLKEIPAYMDYYRLIREKIRRNAYHYYDSATKGEVFVSFIVLKDGNLDTSYINKESVRNPILREIALQSIKDAAPFPKFPDELKHFARLLFNISIFFKSN